EEAKVKEAASKYLSGLSEDDISCLGATTELLEQMYSEYALANKVYLDITRNVNPEISDDEARTISVKHILFKTYTVSADGSTRQFSDEEKKSVYERAEAVLEKIQSGADFDSVAEKYNEDTESGYTFGKGQMPESFEEAAFNLGTDEVSGIIETDFGYHIIKCVSTFDREETDNNKERIVLERKKEAFNEVYDEFLQTLHSNLNNELWDSVDFGNEGTTDATGFFDVYNEVFS
ncbi:MAG: peptidylprolyl isomerase, partial [Lachnospiraceae bacterium]|nr:peptidylprolyl isomerase [Lachnospiraceae bacterium]